MDAFIEIVGGLRLNGSSTAGTMMGNNSLSSDLCPRLLDAALCEGWELKEFSNNNIFNISAHPLRPIAAGKLISRHQ